MEKSEALAIIAELKRGKTYFKPLPYRSVEGGTTVTYDAGNGHFVEEYLNRSIYDRGEEHCVTYRTEEEFLAMLLQGTYTDRKYLLPEESEEYRLE